MKIVHVSAEDGRGGASRAAYRLHEGLREIGQESRMYVRHKASRDPEVQLFVPSREPVTHALRFARRKRLEMAMRRYAKTAPADQTYFSDDRSFFRGDACRQVPPSDVLQLHWIAEFIDYGAFFEWVPENLPLVWTMHDVSSFTGGCCYDLGCGKFERGCGACPQLGSRNENDLSRQVWTRKEKYYAGLRPERFHIVAPSRWMAGEVSRSPLVSRFPRSVIPYGIDLEVFQPRERAFARGVMGIPADAKVVLFVAHEIDTPRKGFRALREAIMAMGEREKVWLVSLGQGPRPELDGFRHTHLRTVTEDGYLSLIYSAADVFVAPSLADNLPNTVLEAIACGTPVVAFDVGGVPDLVRVGMTGLLAKTGDAGELRCAIETVLGNAELRARMSEICRRIAVEEYGLRAQAGRYLSLYEEMLGGRAARQ